MLNAFTVDPTFPGILMRLPHGWSPFTLMMIFGGFIGLITLVKLYLAYRQIRYVAAHRSAVPAAFSSRIDLPAHQKAADYAIAKAKFSMVTNVISALVLLWLTLGGGFDWFTRLSIYPRGGSIFLQTLVLFLGIFILTTVISLVTDYYRIFHLETRFGFNRMTQGLWVTDQIRGILLSVVLELPLLLLAVWIMSKAVTTWWLWLWLVVIVFNVAMVAIYPRYIAPLFNQFKPLEDEALVQDIHALLKANQFKVDGLFVMDGSKRSTHGNAYFTGFGPAKRIVFFDTLLENLSKEEILAVLAHELGHLKKHHIWKSLGSFAVLGLLLLYALYWLSHSEAFYAAVNVHYITLPVTLILYMQLLPFVLFPLTPILSWVSRKHEFEADAFASQQISAQYLISGLVKLFGENASTLTPDPLYSAVYDSHPPASIRVAHLEKLAQ